MVPRLHHGSSGQRIFKGLSNFTLKHWSQSLKSINSMSTCLIFSRIATDSHLSNKKNLVVKE